MPRSFLQTYVLDRYDAGLQKPERGHIVELDSLRGIAALIVVFTHFAAAWNEASPPRLLHYLLYVPFVVTGAGAVMLFFVLSGFVLSLPILSAKRQSYPVYAVRRVCRIYLPYVAALAVAIACCWRFYGLDMYGPDDFHLMWRSAPTLPMVAAHLTFLGRYDVFAYDPPIWSLVHEMRISLIFPLLCLIALRLRPWAAFAIVVAFPVVGRLIEKYSAPYTGGGLGTHDIFWALTVSFCGVFLLGSLLARYREPLVARLERFPAVLRWLFPIAATVLYQFPQVLPIPWYFSSFTVSLGAAYFVILALVPGGWLSRTLRLKPLRFLGRISYSFYLTHMPILTLMSIAIWRRMPYIYLLLPFLAVSLVVAAVFYRFVELPSIALGKAITSKWRRPEMESKVLNRTTEPLA